MRRAHLPALLAAPAVCMTCIALGLAATTFPRYALAGCAAVAIALILIRTPAIGIVAVVAISAILGDMGAHLLVAGLPLLELLLVLASLSAIARTVALPHERIRREILVWVPPALWGLGELFFRNRGNAISGLREALIFIYPAMFALPLLGMPATRVRAWLLRRGHYLCFAAWIVLTIGIYNQATGNLTATSTGQARALGSWSSEALVAGFLASLWLYQVGRLRLLRAVVLAAPIGGLLLVNHRSAYLGVIVAVLSLMVLRAASPSKGGRGLVKLAALVVVGVVFIIVATPVGRAGIDRFLTIASSNDPNIQDRLHRDRNALPTSTVGWAVGDGVGLQPTTITGEVKFGATTNPNATHDSFATMLHLGGSIGLLLLLLPILFVLRRSIRARDDPLVQILLVFTIYTVVMASFNVVLENAYFGGWLWAALLTLQTLVWEDKPLPSGTVRKMVSA